MDQDVINLVVCFVCFPISRRPSVFMNVVMWEYHTLDTKIFLSGKMYYSHPIIFTHFM